MTGPLSRRPESGHDVIVIGAGPNGLVAANALADAGWSVLVLEEQPTPGGSVRSDHGVQPDFVHDTFSAFYPLAAASPTLRSLGLEQHGLQWCHAPAVLGHPRPDGEWALLHRDRELTASLLDAQHPGDGEAWLSLCRQWDVIGDQLVRALLSPFPPIRHGIGALLRLPRAGGLGLLKTLLMPVDAQARRFGGDAPGLLLAGNAGHADIPLDAPGSGLMAMVLAMLGQTVGFPVPRGGASELSAALARRLSSLGGEVICGCRVTGIQVEHGRATAVVTADHRRHPARRAVVADVMAPALYQQLLPAEAVPRRVSEAVSGFELDPGTVKVDWALSGPVPWSQAPPHAPGTLHIADSLDDIRTATAQVRARTIPHQPFLLAGQMTTTDATRSPAGTESMWAYAHVPQPDGSPVEDAGVDRGMAEIQGRWDERDRERYADRMQQRIERLAPGFGDRVIARRVLGPRELQQRNANLVGGAINGGTAQLHQQLIFRPIPGLGRASTCVAGVYLASASAHPGGGVHGACGMNAARAVLAASRLGRLPRIPT